MPKLCALVAYYPTSLPHVNAGFPPSVRVLAHLAGKVSSAPKWGSYTYPHAESGFAEEGTGAYEKVSAGLAWSRTLGVLRKGFGIEVDLEGVWEKHLACMLDFDFTPWRILFEVAVADTDEAYLSPNSGVLNQKRRRHNVHHGPIPIREPRADPHRWYWVQGPAPLLQGLLHSDQSAIPQYSFVESDCGY